MHFIGILIAAAALVAGLGFMARQVGNMPRTPAPVRRAANGTAGTIRHPVRSARKGAPRAAQSAEAIWAKARSDNWLEKQRSKRERRAGRPSGWETTGKAAKAVGRGARKAVSSIPRPRVAVNLPGVTGKKPDPRPEASLAGLVPPAVAKPALAVVPDPKPATTTPATPAVTGRPVNVPSIRHSVPPDFAAVIARIHNTEHETDIEYLTFARGLAAGEQGIAEALDDHADQLLNGIGLDPAAVKCWHDISAAFTECAAQITQAEKAYQSTYQGATEDASRGVVMPYRGRFISGETA